MNSRKHEMRKPLAVPSICFLFLSLGAATSSCSTEENPGPSTVIVVPDSGGGTGGSNASPEAAAPAEDAGSPNIDAPVSYDAATPVPSGDGGPGLARDPRCLPSGASVGDAGCNCILATNKELLNQCTGNQCQPYDNARIKNAGFVPGEPLPPVP